MTIMIQTLFKGRRIFFVSLVASLLMICGLLQLPSVVQAGKSVPVPAGRTEITFWHAMNGPNEKVLQKIVAQFNQKQHKYWVTPIYEGSYGLLQSKYTNTLHSNVTPALVQIDQGNGAAMIGIDNYVPMQKFIDRDHFDTNQIYPSAMRAYSIKGQLLSMPFNSSTAVLYYNKDLFKKYGIKPLSQSPTYSEVRTAAQQLTQKSHQEVKGITLQIYDWLANELVANQNVSVVDHGNGREAVATKSNMNTPEMRRTFQWVQQMIKDGSFQNYGTGSSASANQMAGFLSQKLGIFMQSSAAMSSINKSAKFHYGVCYMPHPDGVKANGVAIGGASLWITKEKDKAIQEGAWQFVKYAASPVAQAQWQVGTGYIANNKRSLQVPVLAKAIAKNPNLKVPVDQLLGAQQNAASAGPFYANVADAARYLQIAEQQIYAGGNIATALATAQKQTNQAIAQTNQTSYDLLNFNR
ncbi:ABC transporter substrate-binding protein [Agrilactobacillus fermenti]|uniref:ABC transporter substrate-binding protein n=1 Tax=Agrilactobacillus fermenti TaxID=2586909 RepID=UPI003A5BF877